MFIELESIIKKQDFSGLQSQLYYESFIVSKPNSLCNWDSVFPI